MTFCDENPEFSIDRILPVVDRVQYRTTNTVHTVQADNAEVYYLVHTYVREMSNLGYAGIYPLKIDDHRLVPVALFDESPDGCGHNCTFREYAIAEWYFRTNNGEGWDWIHSYDEATRTFYIPELVDMDMTDRYALYTFDGEKFVLVRDDGGFWLHPEIRDFKRLETLFLMEDYRIRVDMMPDGTYRYACWKSDVSMNSLPDIILCNGTYDEHRESYCFENAGFRYMVCAGDNGKLSVIHNGRQILYQEQISG